MAGQESGAGILGAQDRLRGDVELAIVVERVNDRRDDELTHANGRQDEVGVNPDPKESNLDVIPGDVLALWQGKGGQSSREGSASGPSTAGAAAPSKTPQSFWWYVMLLVFVAAIAESTLASRYLGTQREE